MVPELISSGHPPALAPPSAPTLGFPGGVPGSCAWWNLACKGGEQVANAGLSAITKSIASGAEDLLSQIVRIIDESSTVPLADPTYRHVYFGFLGLAATLIAVVLLIALIIACIRRDAATLGRAAVGVGVAALGGALYIVFAQLLVAVDDWLSHGVVDVTGYNLTTSISQIAVGFHNIAGAPGEMAANMLLILLMLIMLVSGLILWFVLVLRKIAILVVVAFAPLLIAGYGWTPTRAWVRRTTEVLVALVFTKTAIYTLFGIGLALMSRGTDQSLSDFVGTTVLMCGACFAPLVMLKLVHFAGDTQLAHDAMSSLHSGVKPVTQRMGMLAPGAAMGRGDLARSQATSPTPEGPGPSSTGVLNPTAGGSPAAAGGAEAGEVAAGAATGGAATAAFVAADAAKSLKDSPQKVAGHAAGTATALLERDGDRAMRGPNPGEHSGRTDEGDA